MRGAISLHLLYYFKVWMLDETPDIILQKRQKSYHFTLNSVSSNFFYNACGLVSHFVFVTNKTRLTLCYLSDSILCGRGRNDSYCSQNIVKKNEMGGAHMGERRSACRVLMGNPKGKRTVGKPSPRWEDNFKIDFKEMLWVYLCCSMHCLCVIVCCHRVITHL
jgi:hypothetical protein